MQIKTTADQITDVVRNEIFIGKYLPGDKLKENEIAMRLSVSRTPVREALRKLEAEGLAEFWPNKGVIVPQISDHDIDEIYELRTLIELHCIRKFIKIATEKHFEELENIIEQMKKAISGNDIPVYFSLSLDFHAYYVRHCQNSRMYSFFNSIRNTMRMAQSILGKTGSFNLKLMDKQHIKIMELLKNRSPECEKVLKQHIEEACNQMREKVKKD
jgi:DNA-binding GntR family transcriptional regulator